MCQYIKVSIKHVNVREGGVGLGSCFEFDQNTINGDAIKENNNRSNSKIVVIFFKLTRNTTWEYRMKPHFTLEMGGLKVTLHGLKV